MARKYPCGCIDGYYWCAKHDIYTKQNRKSDPRWNGEWREHEPTGCMCHISAPCSFCTKDVEDTP